MKIQVKGVLESEIVILYNSKTTDQWLIFQPSNGNFLSKSELSKKREKNEFICFVERECHQVTDFINIFKNFFWKLNNQ